MKTAAFTIIVTVLNIVIACAGAWWQYKGVAASYSALQQSWMIHEASMSWERSPFVYFDTAPAPSPVLKNFGKGPAFNVKTRIGQSEEWHDVTPMHLLPGKEASLIANIDFDRNATSGGQIQINVSAVDGRHHSFYQDYSVDVDNEGNQKWTMGEIHDYKINGAPYWNRPDYIIHHPTMDDLFGGKSQ
jgi:hypothetical protein